MAPLSPDIFLRRTEPRSTNIAHFFAADGRVLYYDLRTEPIFGGSGDMQFQVYRDMRESTDHQWHNFFPETNAQVSSAVLDCRGCSMCSTGMVGLSDRLVEKDRWFCAVRLASAVGPFDPLHCECEEVRFRR